MNKLVPLLAITVGLGALVWLDNQPLDQQAVDSTQVASTDQDAAISTDTNGIGPAPDGTGNSNSPTPAEREQSRDPNSTGIPANSNPLATLDKDDLRDTVERPLFAPSRRRPRLAAASAPATAEPAAYSSFELVGIAKADHRTIALVRRRADGASFRLQTGDSVDNWTLAKIERTSIVLNSNDGSSATVQLGSPKKPACTPGSAGCPAPAPTSPDFMP